MKVSKLFPTLYLKGVDLGDRRITVAIKEVTQEVMRPDGKETLETVVWFERASKGLVLNKTNAYAIAHMYGDETDNWVGKRITLYAKTMRFLGKQQEVVVVDNRMPPAPTLQEEQEDDPTGDDSTT